jgi:LmbE family N-acetylglucosaminyl deacetylase
MKSPHRVLAFCCHPDDVEFVCAGTLALLAQQGCEMHIGIMAGGDVGSPTLSRREIRDLRLKEAQAAADVIGAKLHFAGGEDLEVTYNDDYRRRAVRVLRAASPTIVFTHPPMDYLVDHEETSRLVRNAAFIAPVPNYDAGTSLKPTERIPHLYYANAISGKNIFGQPLSLTCAVNISNVIEIKTKMLACHASQREWLRAIMKCDEYLDLMRNMSAIDGKRAGVAYAEGFIQHLGEGHPQDNVLKQLLGEQCIEFTAAR